MSQKIALIACSKRKLGKNTPNQSFLAQDIYQGNIFKTAKEKGLKNLLVMIGLFFQEKKITIC